ncbi:MAG TPA: response regulator [Desulfonatronum sp.]|nr:response regulator [Desulfonatronum sp.]
MRQYSTEQLDRFKSAFEKYMDAYMTRRDLASLREMVTEDFCGSGTGLDEVFYDLQVYRESGKEIDLVLLDLNMPGMGGHKCLQELLQLDPSVKVVIVSGYSAMHFGKNTIASGAKDFISKPYQLTELEAKVREVLSG